MTVHIGKRAVICGNVTVRIVQVVYGTTVVWVKVVAIVVGIRVVLWTRMTPRVVTGISTVLVLVRRVVTVTSTVSVLVVVRVVVRSSVTVVVCPPSGDASASRLKEAKAMMRIRIIWLTIRAFTFKYQASGS